MIDLHPQYLTRNGKAEFAVLPIEEFEHLKIYLEDLEDVLALHQAKETEANSPTLGIDELHQRLDDATV